MKRIMLNWISAAALTVTTFTIQAQTVVEYIHTDALGTPVAVTDANQNVVEHSEYEPYGRLVNRPIAGGPGYTGHVSDAETGLSYMQQRYYDPELARFLSSDPVSALTTPGRNFNRFWYANNNPYRFIDPDGRWICEGKNCLAFEKALARVASAVSNPRLDSNERSAMQRIVKFYGEKGDGKVSVSFKSMDGQGGTATIRKDGGEHIAIDMKRAERKSEDATLHVLARVVAHEGEHGANDQARGAPVATRAERLKEEIAGYTMQAYYQKAANFSDSAGDGWTIWGGLMGENIKRQANGSITTSCGASTEGSCK